MSKNREQRPDFIGIGVMKAASSWIFACLKEHPAICVSKKKEIHFFDKLYNYKKGIDYYYSFFKHCPADKVKGEFTPYYMYSSQAPSLIYKHFPNVKLIACLRDPIERAYSNYRYNIELKGRLSIYKNIEEALTKDKNFVERGFYYAQLKRYFDLFPKENILVLFLKELKDDPIKFMQRIYSFLDLDDPEFIPNYATKKKNVTGHRTVQYKIPFINLFIYKIRLLIKKDSSLEKLIFKNRLNEYLENIVNYNKRITNTKIKEDLSTPSSYQEARKYIYQIYKDDIQKLEKLLKKDLSEWK